MTGDPRQDQPRYPDLEGKTAVVTGGSRGIGAATARSLVACGAKVVINGRDTNAIDALVADIQSKGGQAIGIAADCTDFSALEQLRARVEVWQGMGYTSINTIEERWPSGRWHLS